MFKVIIGTDGLNYTWQKPFEEEVECKYCGGTARIAFVVFESQQKTFNDNENFVCNLHKNDPEGKGYWLHDCCAVAVYFCKQCLEPTAKYNQG
jgi:hypothetical protein